MAQGAYRIKVSAGMNKRKRCQTCEQTSTACSSISHAGSTKACIELQEVILGSPECSSKVEHNRASEVLTQLPNVKARSICVCVVRIHCCARTYGGHTMSSGFMHV